MIRLLLAGRRLSALPALMSELDREGIHLTHTESGQKILIAVADQQFDLLIADDDLGDMTGLELIKVLVTLNPMLNCAAVSSLTPDEFHEASEGLGVLMQLSHEPDTAEIQQLLEHLGKIQSMARTSGLEESKSNDH